MFQNITTSYTLTDATTEIAIMLAGAFILGFALAWFLKPTKRYTKKIINAEHVNIPSYVASKEMAAAKSTPKNKIVKKVVEDTPKQDDLKLIEWIGPKIEKLLQKNNITTFADVVQADVQWLEEILKDAGPKYQMHVPTTWPDQARLAHKGKWRELEEYQEILNKGRKM